MRHKSTKKLLRLSVFGMALLPAAILAQNNTDDELSDDIFLLSPFEVTTESNSGYTTTETLAGTRIKTDLRDLAQSISVINTQFLKDTGATSSEDLLVYTTNTEVGGIGGNFSGIGGGSSYSENSKLLRPNENNRVRGLDSADNTRNYFLTEAAWDGYNIDRVEMQRGPNSILFGVGSPAGIVNVTSKTAFFENERKVEVRVDEEGSLRGVVDLNQEIIEDELAVRVIVLDEHTKYTQKPAYEKDKRIYGAVRYEPQLIKGNPTSINVNFEHAEIEANRPRSMPPIDNISAWFKTGSNNGISNPSKLLVDPNTDYGEYGEDWNGTGAAYPWFRGGFMGRIMGSDVSEFYSNGTHNPGKSVQAMPSAQFGRGRTGEIDAGIGGIPFTRPFAITNYHSYAGIAGVLPDGNFYSNYSLTDPTIFDFYNNLLDGDNKGEWQEWDTFNASVAQSFMNNRFGFELSYFWQNYEEGQHSLLGGESGDQYSISVDINSHYVDGTENPNAGRAYVANSGEFGNVENSIDRNSVRLSAFADIRATDFFEESLLTRILGHHLVSGLLSRDVRKNDYRDYVRWALDTDYTDETGLVSGITDGTRMYDWVYYLNDENLSSYDSASGINLSGVSTIINPTGSVTMDYYDSHWIKGTSVDPGAWWDSNEDGVIQYVPDEDGNPTSVIESYETQAENPANYAGWKSKDFSILNASDGDIEHLYKSATKSRNRIFSQAITLQSYMFDDSIVFTYGWRKDKVKNVNSQAPKLDHGVADANFVLNEFDDESGVNRAEGQSRTWGVVAHAPEFITKNLPWDMKLSAFYGKGSNFKADAPRGDIYGNQIPNPKGQTEDYGFVVSILNNRFSLKTTWYETSVTDATLPYDSAGFGGTLYKVWAVPYWGVAHALNGIDYLVKADGTYRQNPGWHPGAQVGDTDKDGVFDNQAIFEACKDMIVNLPIDQSFADEYGIDLNVAALHAAADITYDPNMTDEERLAAFQGFYDGLPSWTGITGEGGVGPQTAYKGKLKSFGSNPVASGDTVSEGIEFEFNARITDNWNMMLNVSKTEATVTAISPAIKGWIETYTEFLNGPAGDVMIWGGNAFRNDWAAEVLAPYNALMAKVGGGASEVSPWRANLVTNYNFSEGFLKGVNIGLAYRWEDKRVLGYQTAYSDAANDYILDISKPWKGPTEDHIDLWVGYGFDITDDVNWRIQLNIRNVGESNHLVPVYIQPDGTTGYSRIAYGTSWFITNTFTF